MSSCVARIPLLYSHPVKEPELRMAENHRHHHHNPSLDNLTSSSSYASSLESSSSFSDDHGPEAGDQKELSELNVSTVEVVYGKTRHEIVIDDNLTANGFCQLLKLKLNLNQAENWSLVLRIPKEKIQRLLEDEEEVLPIYNRYKVFLCYLSVERNSVLKKYDFFEHPSLYFDPEMIAFVGEDEELKETMNKQIKMNRICSQLHAFEKFRVTVSGPLSLLEKSDSGDFRAKTTMASMDTGEDEFNSNFGQSLVCSEVHTGQKKTFDVFKHDIFYPIHESRNPADHRFCLVDEDTGLLTWFASKAVNQRNCWLTVLRLVKYGLKELKRCYKASRRSEKSSSNGGSSGPLTSSSSYVDMGQGKAIIDYTHKDGPRVIEDPKEILSIVDEESNQWRKRLDSDSSRSRSYSSSLCSSPGTLTPKSCSSSPTKYHQTYGSGSHQGCKPASNNAFLDHPWFYDNLTREEAQKLLEKYETVDGVFLVRTSVRNPDGFVLSLVVNNKIKHIPIKRIDMDNQLCWTLDFGKTKFYDIQQLIEFYQLNATCLPTRLTHFLVHKHH